MQSPVVEEAIWPPLLDTWGYSRDQEVADLTENTASTGLGVKDSTGLDLSELRDKLYPVSLRIF